MNIETCFTCLNYVMVDQYLLCKVTIKHTEKELLIKHCADVNSRECCFKGNGMLYNFTNNDFNVDEKQQLK